MSDKILMVFEGVKTEPIYFRAILKIYFPKFFDHIVCAFENNIYDLWRELNDDPDLDIVEVVRGRNDDNKKVLADLRRSEISQTYLFFDFDAHDRKYEKNKVIDLLKIFSNETENGAIFVSYPMVESLRHFPSAEDFYQKKVKIFDANYKNLVHQEVSKLYAQIGKVSEADFHNLIWHHIVKAGYLCGIFELCDKPEIFCSMKLKYVDQNSIFFAQLAKYVEVDSTVAVLSGFPMFIYQYFGVGIFQKLGRDPRDTSNN